MATSKTIKIDFKEIQASIVKFYHDVIKYFKNLTQDMIIAWSVLGIGLIVLIVGLVL